MRIEIEIPKEFEIDYNGDMFKDFFSRVLYDIEEGRCLCGSYEKETVEMFLKAFDESKKAYDVDAVVAELQNGQMWKEFMIYNLTHREREIIDKAIEIVRKGGAE